MHMLLGDILGIFSNTSELLGKIGWTIVKILIIFAVVQIAISLLSRVVKKFLDTREKLDERRRETLESMLHNLIRVVLYVIFILTVLPMFGIKIAALIAGAGVAGIAIAFGAQSLLRDYFNGFFILFEDQFGVGDYVVINGEWGQVQEVSLRLTTMQYWTGKMIYIPNGQITQVVNYSQRNSTADIQIEVGYNTDTEKAISIVNKVIHQVQENEEDVVGDVAMMGVESLNDSTYTVRCYVECNSYTHWGIRRKVKELTHNEFRKQGIDLPIQKTAFMHEDPIDETTS